MNVEKKPIKSEEKAGKETKNLKKKFHLDDDQ